MDYEQIARITAPAQLVAGFVGGVLLTLAVVWMSPRNLFQVASSGRHALKPWFQGKRDCAPEVPDLHEPGFELLGLERSSNADRSCQRCGCH